MPNRRYFTLSVPTLRRFLRRPSIYWSIAVACAAWAAALIATAVPDPDAPGRTVVVTVGNVAAGDRLAEHTDTVLAPDELVPARAVAADAIGDDTVAGRPLGAGEIVTSTDLGAAIAPGVGEAGVAIPTGPATPGLASGSRVMVVVAADPLSGLPAGTHLGRVLSPADDHTLVAVAQEAVADIARAVQNGSVTLALAP